MTKRSRRRDIDDEIANEIANLNLQLADLEEIIKEKAAEEKEIAPQARKTRQELSKLQAQLAKAVLSDEEKAFLQAKQQEAEFQSHDLTAVRTALEQLRKKEEQLRDDKKALREQLQKQVQVQPGLQQQLQTLPNPSDMVNSNIWSLETNHGFFRCLRPTAGVGATRALPVALYDAVLDKAAGLFREALLCKWIREDDSRSGSSSSGCAGVGGSSSSGSSGGGCGVGGVPPSDADCFVATSLCAAMAKSFPSEADRMVAFVKILSEYLGEPIKPDSPILGADFKTYGSLLCQVGPVSLPVYIQELKNEIGTSSGDPYFQGQRYYQLYVASPELAEWVRHSVLPVLFLELVGPHLRVSALASPADVTVVCEPLTPYLHLFSMHRCQPDHMVRLALVLRALKRSIGLLKDACVQQLQKQQLTVAAAAAPPAAAEPAAFASTLASLASAAGSEQSGASASAASASAGEGGSTARRGVVPLLRDAALQLPYPLRLGTRFTEVVAWDPGVYNPLYFAKYRPKLDADAAPGAAAAATAPAAGPPVAVVVKFSHMSAHAVDVQRAWAAADLAPKVFTSKRLGCGLTMLVMEQLEEAQGWRMFHGLEKGLKAQLHGAVVEALGRAHALVVDQARGLRGVHADLRQANVMVQLLMPQGGGGGGSGGGGGGSGGRGGVNDAAPQPQIQVRFVDFDWAGLQGHTRLPAFSRKRLKDYECGCEVTQEYDWLLWEHEAVYGSR